MSHNDRVELLSTVISINSAEADKKSIDLCAARFLSNKNVEKRNGNT